MERIVVVGAGLAGLRSVQSLRGAGYKGQLTMLGSEPHPPYDRPPLSKGLLSGDVSESVLPVDWESLDVELLLNRRATRLRSEVVETDGGSVDFDGLIIATGATAIRLPGNCAGRTLRTIDDAWNLHGSLKPGTHLVIIGAGWIGAEVATTAVRAGCRVTVVEASEAPLAGVLGLEVGKHMEQWYADAGIELIIGTLVEGVEEHGVALKDGGFLPADEVLIAVGARPETDWLVGSPLTPDGISADGAIVTDEGLRTSVQGICAVGDCATWWSGRYEKRLRVEHWDNALSGPPVAAANLLGKDSEYDPVPYFWSEQHGRMVQYAGHHSATDEVVWRGTPDESQWAVCWLVDDVMTAILAVDKPRDLAQARKMLLQGERVDLVRLTDPSISLRSCTISAA